MFKQSNDQICVIWRFPGSLNVGWCRSWWSTSLIPLILKVHHRITLLSFPASARASSWSKEPPSSSSRAAPRRSRRPPPTTNTQVTTHLALHKNQTSSSLLLLFFLPLWPVSRHVSGDLPQHLQIMFKVLRSEDRIKLVSGTHRCHQIVFLYNLLWSSFQNWCVLVPSGGALRERMVRTGSLHGGRLHQRPSGHRGEHRPGDGLHWQRLVKWSARAFCSAHFF